jgi:hypothetical protein
MSGDTIKIERQDGKLETKKCACNGTDAFVIADLTGRIVTHLEPSASSGITSVTLQKLSANQTTPTPISNPSPDPVWAESYESGAAISFTVTAGKINKLPDLGQGMNWGKCKLVFNNTPTSAHWLGIHCGS